MKKEIDDMKTNLKKAYALLLTLALVFSAVACSPVGSDGDQDQDKTPGVVENGATIGQGSKTFTMEVTDAEGATITFTVKTDEKTVGAALLALEVIAGDPGEYGLYVKTVNGTTVDYDTDGAYWAFYVDGAYATTGVDQTDIADGSTYAFKVEK